MPSPPINVVHAADNESLARFQAFIGDAKEVWFIEGAGGTNFDQPYKDWLNQHYVPFFPLSGQNQSLIEYTRSSYTHEYRQLQLSKYSPV
jgi:hypothetical protein